MVFGVYGCYEDTEPWYTAREYRKIVLKEARLRRAEIPGMAKAKALGFYMEMDHVVPLWLGWTLGIEPKELSSLDNLQVICGEDNSCTTKYGKGGLAYEDWHRKITGKPWVYCVGVCWFQYLADLCMDLDIPLVKVVGQFARTEENEVTIGGVEIYRTILPDGNKDFGRDIRSPKTEPV